MPTLPTSTRFFQPGVIQFVWLPAIADAAGLVPTTTEITAGTNLTKEVDDIAGWTTSTAFIETKDASTPIRPQLAGAITMEGSSITFNGSLNGTDARTVFTAPSGGTIQVGFMLIADGGLGTGKLGEVFPASVGGVTKIRSLDNAPFKIRVDFGITGLPRDVTLP